MAYGTVKWFNADKGYGFIAVDDGRDIFVHSTAIRTDGYRVLEEGQRVVFEITQDDRGTQAETVRVLLDTGAISGQAETLPRLDGLYRADDGDFSRFLRFSSFNRVSLATTTRDANAEDVARWLSPEHAFSGQGIYALSGHQVSFTAASPQGRIAYTGLLSSDGSAISLSLPFESVYSFTRTGIASAASPSQAPIPSYSAAYAAHSTDATVNPISPAEDSATPSGFVAHFLAMWEPAISALVAADHGDARASAALNRYLGEWEDSTDWAALATVLARIKAGDRYDPNLVAGLDRVDTIIVTRALDALAGKVSVSPVLGPAIKFGTMLCDLVFAAAHDDATQAEDARGNLRIAAANGHPILAAVLTRILDGDRNPDLVSGVPDPFERDVVKTVLHYIPLAEAEEPGKPRGASPRAVYQLGVQLGKQGDVSGARDAFTRALESGDPDVAPGAALDLGLACQLLGDLNGARSAYQWAIDCGDADAAPLAARDLGLMLKQAGDTEEAVSLYRQAIASGHPEAAPTAANNLGMLLEDLGDVDGAVAAYRYAVQSRHPAASASAAYQLGFLLFGRGDMSGARAMFQVAAESGDEDEGPPAAKALGDVLASQGDADAARRAYRQAIDSCHRDAAPWGWLGLGALLGRGGDGAGQLDAFRQAIASGHHDAAPRAAALLGMALQEQGDVRGAMNAFHIAADSGHPEAGPAGAYQLGKELREQGDLRGAYSALKQAMDSGNPDAAPHAAKEMAVLLSRQGDFPGACTACQVAIDSGDADAAPRAAVILGILLTERGDLPGARNAYQYALSSGHQQAASQARAHLSELGGLKFGRSLTHGKSLVDVSYLIRDSSRRITRYAFKQCIALCITAKAARAAAGRPMKRIRGHNWPICARATTMVELTLMRTKSAAIGSAPGSGGLPAFG
jgi:cold shock CspA family protein/tetratricopeptide (TPR) repeat protein